MELLKVQDKYRHPRVRGGSLIAQQVQFDIKTGILETDSHVQRKTSGAFFQNRKIVLGEKTFWLVLPKMIFTCPGAEFF